MNKIVFNIVMLLLLISGSTLNAQILPALQQAFTNYQQKVFQEKMFMHTDKESYLVGELIWFKIYNVDATNRQPATISKIAYVEVLDQQNNPILQTKIELNNGSGSGSLDIPNMAKSGKYKLRAYTNWMKNFGPDVFFEKPLVLLNPQNAPEKQNATNNTTDLQFFPEGGDLVVGITSTVGFRAISPNGKGIFLKGAVVDDRNDTVARFQTLKFGNGQFKFTPISGRTYKAIAIISNGEVLIKELPLALRQGYVMNLTHTNSGKLDLVVRTNIAANRVYAFIHQGKKVIVALDASIDEKKATLQIDKEKLPEGISYITIFDQEGKPVCERLFFKPPTKKLQILAKSDLLQYKQRQKVAVNIETKNEISQPKEANLSVSVRKLDSLEFKNQNDITSYMWLSSELKGEFESPEYYLNNTTEESNQALENLLLTQGWRKLNWTEVLQNTTPSFKYLPEYNGHIVSGTLKNGNVPSEVNTLVYMSVPSRRLQFYASKTDANGKFLFNTKDFYGSNEVIIQTNYKIDSTSTISIQSPFSEQYSTTKYTPLTLQQNVIGQLEKRNLGVQVQNMYVSNQMKQFYAPNVDSTDFFQTAYKTYKINEYTRFNRLEDVLREYVREVLVSKRNNNFHMNMVSKTVYFSEDPLVLIDGVPHFDFNKLMTIDPNVFEKLEVVRDQYYYGSIMAEGILKFTTYKSKLSTVELDPHAIVLDYEGMQLQREFYMPVYDNAEQKNSRLPDFRNVLYWSPNLTTNVKGVGQFSFYTSDQPGTYIGVIQGMTNEGLAGSKTFTFEVVK
ncbi:hypothetical protein [Pedobacter boryungensis]|uniref:MG2 domain-containing protein n=1 Tax=Pedobacter boryungensis TaxID=869962 RepID=A0ABX2DC47_9SPHI|nr:hypothetical protein [Pedobacter boryungensis]NQX31653.1 hypothetical protein [Pedobacter boryungensis]